MRNVLLIGIGGVYNYGCEAIVRGTVNILKSINPEVKISYASYNYGRLVCVPEPKKAPWRNCFMMPSV